MPEEAGETEGVGEKDIALNVVYQVQITLADGTVYELSSLGMDDIDQNAELCLEDDVVFVKYTPHRQSHQRFNRYTFVPFFFLIHLLPLTFRFERR